MVSIRVQTLEVFHFHESSRWFAYKPALERGPMAPTPPSLRRPAAFPRQQRLKRALAAKGIARATEMFAHDHELGVVILPVVEAPGGRLFAQGDLAKRLQIIIPGFGLAPAVPMKNPSGIGVDDEAVMPACVEQHGASELRPR